MCAAFWLLAPLPVRGAGGMAVVTNTGDDTVSVVQLTSQEVTTIADPSLAAPAGVVAVRGGRFAAVANRDGDSVSWIDLTTAPPQVISAMGFDGSPRGIATAKYLLLVSVDVDDDFACNGGDQDGNACQIDAECGGICDGGLNDLLSCSGASDCPGECDGGFNDGGACDVNGDCGAACVGGLNDQQSCSVDAECFGACNGGSNHGDPCNGDSDCSPGACENTGTCVSGSCLTGACESGTCELQTENDDMVVFVDTRCLPDCDPDIDGRQGPDADAIVDELALDGSVAPAGIGAAANGRLAMVALSKVDEVAYINLNDVTAPELLDDTTPVGSRPTGVAVAANRRSAIAANATGQSLSFIDLTDLRDEVPTSSTIISANTAPAGVTAARNALLTTLAGPGGALGVVTGGWLQTTPFGVDPLAITAQKMSGVFKIGVTDAGSRTLSIVDASTGAVELQAAVGSDPEGVALIGNRPPLARIIGGADSFVLLRANFDASRSADKDGSVVQYQMDFGDGTAATMSSPLWSHDYPAPGRYTAYLTVYDNAGDPSVSAARFTFFAAAN